MFCESLGQQTVPTDQTKYLCGPGGNAAALQNACVPNGLKRGTAASSMAQKCIGSSVAFHQLRRADLIQTFQAGHERLIFVHNLPGIFAKIETLRVPPGMIAKEIDLALVQTQRGKHSRAGQILFRIDASADDAQHIVAAAIPGDAWKIEFAHIRPIQVVTWFGELLRSGVDVKPVRQALAQCFHVTTDPIRCFKHSNVVAAPRQLIRATKAGNAAPDYNLFSSFHLGQRPQAACSCWRRSPGVPVV